MVRSADPPGRVKHLRFGKTSPEIYEAIVGFPGVKSVVLHTHGAKGEHPHYHVWWEGDKEVTNQTIRNHMKKIPVFSSFSSQNDWSFRNHDSWETWASYVCSNMSHKVLLVYKDIEEISKIKSIPITVISLNIPNTPSIAGPPRPKLSISMRAKFARYLENECFWKKYEEITIENAADKLQEMNERLTDFLV